MAGNALSTFTQNVPAHIARAMETGEGNIEARATVPSLTYGGKKWTIALNGDQKVIQKKGEDGEMEPLTVLPVIILDYAKRRGRAFYEGAYDPAKPGKPLCWSSDGIAPDKGIKEPQASKCAKCPMSEKGSRVADNGKASYACSEFRMLAVVPAGKPDFEPLRLKLAMTSDYDGQSPDLAEKEYFAFSNYKDYLRANGVNSTYMLVTKMRFDPNVDWPKVIFHRGDWLDEDAYAIAAEAAQSQKVKDLLSGAWSPEGADGVATDDDEVPAPKPKAKPAIEPDDDEPAPKPKKAQPPVDDDEAPAPKRKPKPAVDDDDDLTPAPKPKTATSKPLSDDDIELTTTPKAKQAEVAARQKAKKAAELDDDEPAPKPKANGKKAAAVDDDDETPAKPAAKKPSSL